MPNCNFSMEVQKSCRDGGHLTKLFPKISFFTWKPGHSDMFQFNLFSHLLPLLLSIHLLFPFSAAVIGSAAYYTSPYLPSACFGNDPSQFPSNLVFAMADKGTWDNGAVCGRQFLVKCISGGCISDRTLRVRVVDNAATSVTPPSVRGTNFVLSQQAFAMIAHPNAKQINIDYRQIEGHV